MAVKRRTELTHFSQSNTSTYVGQNLIRSTTDSAVQQNRQATVSFSHPIRKAINLKVGQINTDWGGPFLSRKAECITNFVEVDSKNGPTGSTWYSFKGKLHALQSNVGFTELDFISGSSPAALAAFGTTAIARTIPTNATAGLGQFLGELKNLPQRFTLHKWKPEARVWLNKYLQAGRNFNSARKFSARAANDWLNLQFGWLPFVSDILDTVEAIGKMDKTLQQFARDSGKNVRRSFSMPSDIQTETVKVGGAAYGHPVPPTWLVQTPGVLYRTTTTTTSRWFKGCYTYYLPETGLASVEAKVNKVFGTRINPKLLWQLAPWSWAIDWVTNAGDVVHNWSAFSADGLVLRYGYVMETITKTDTYSLLGLALKNNTSNLDATQMFIRTTKQRVRATPYGFGLDPGTFSNRQWSIIAALGISKAPRSLNF